MSVNHVCVARLSDLPPGACRSVEVNGLGIALVNLDGVVYALDNTCPHAGGPLGEGALDGQTLVCPWHGWRFDVRSGVRADNPVFRVFCFPVRIDDDTIWLDLPETLPSW